MCNIQQGMATLNSTLKATRLGDHAENQANNPMSFICKKT